MGFRTVGVSGLLLALACSNRIAVDSVQKCGAPEGPATLPALSPTARQTAFFGAHPLPQLMNHGGPIISSPSVIAVFFPDDPLQQETEALLQSFGCTDAWRNAVAEYGVGDAVYARSVVSQTQPPDVSDYQATAEWVHDHATLIGTTTKSSIVFLFMPDLPDEGCQDSGGFHEATVLHDGDPLTAYAVVKACNYNQRWVTPMALRAQTATHELLEASLDPQPSANPGWVGLDQLEFPILNGASENADLCESQETSTTDYPFAVASGWSNRRAAAGLNPCSSSHFDLATASAIPKVIDLSGKTASFDVAIYSDDTTLSFLPVITQQQIFSSCLSIVVDLAFVADGATAHVTLAWDSTMCSATDPIPTALTIDLYDPTLPYSTVVLDTGAEIVGL